MITKPDQPPRSPEIPAVKPALRDWIFVFLLMTTMIFSYVDRFTLALLVQPIKADLGMSDAQIGLLNGIAFGLFFAFMGMPLGWLADRWSRIGTIILGVGIWSLSTAASGFAGSFYQLLFARMGVGAGEAGLAPAGYGLIHDRFPRPYLARAVSLFQLGTALGSGTALLVGGFFYHLFLNGFGAGLPYVGSMTAWQKTFLAVAMPGIILMCLLSLIKEPDRRSEWKDGEGRASSTLDALRKDPFGYVTLFLGASCLVAASYSLTAWMPAILGREFGWTPSRIGSIGGLVALTAGPTGMMLGGIAVDWLTTRGVKTAYIGIALASSFASLPLMLLVGHVSTTEGLIPALTALLIALTVPVGIIPALVQIETPAAARGRVSGLYVISINLIGLGIAPALIGAISDHLGKGAGELRHALLDVTVPFLAGSIILFAMLWSVRRRAASSTRAETVVDMGEETALDPVRPQR